MVSKEQIEKLQKKINSNPNDIDSFIKLANLLKNNNRKNISLKVINTGLKLNSRNRLLYKEKIKILYELQQYSNCISLLENKEKKDSEDILILIRCYLHTNNLKEIDEILLNLDPLSDDYNFLECLGHLNRFKKDYDQAVKHFKKCIALKPNQIDGYINLFTILREDPNTHSSYLLEYTKKQTNKFPKNLQSKINYLISLILAEEIDEASELLKNLQDTDINNRELASLNLYLRENYSNITNDNFCNKPYDYVSNFNTLKNDLIDNNYLEDLKKAILSLPLSSTSFRTDINAKRTEGNLSFYDDPYLVKAHEIIKIFYQKYVNFLSRKKENIFSRNLPSGNLITSWSMIAEKESYHFSHNHHSAWVSGVFYIEVPKTHDHLGGSIIFSPNGYDYPVKKKSDDLIIKPKSGEIIFFPSHLFHKTLPTETASTRICLPFNIFLD
tara:strand:- start:242 stop:1567 length:1326 start_codon:yes stop_codon:yes gene_type:complete